MNDFVAAELQRAASIAGEPLYEGFDATAPPYFERHSIRWWGGAGRPTDRPLSSQVACVNHLEAARLDPDVALAICRSVLPDASGVIKIEDEGWCPFEWIGRENYLGEHGYKRGQYRTSLDALMVAEDSNAQRCLVPIEWKYTETEHADKRVSEKGTDRIEIYRELLERNDCPIAHPRLEDLFYDPFYQLMRQTLLSWQMVEAGEFGAQDWVHVHVVPAGNRELRETVASPRLRGSATMEAAWRSALKKPDRYVVMTPTELMARLEPAAQWRDWREWLRRRYAT